MKHRRPILAARVASGKGATRRRGALIASVIAGALALTSVPARARADGEAWFIFEYRLPVVAAHGGPARWPRVDVRLLTDVRFNGRSSGLGTSFFRVGPLVYFTPWLFVGTHATVAGDRLRTGAYEMEARAELEPTLFFRFGPVTLSDRNRVEYRWRPTLSTVRYRNMLRVNYAPIGSRIQPFLWDELLIDLTGAGVQQNRATVGVAFMLNNHTRLDVGYMFRSRVDGTAWVHDHVGMLYLFVDVPVAAPAPLPPPATTPGPTSAPMPPAPAPAPTVPATPTPTVPSTSATPELAPAPHDASAAPLSAP